jgi:hypothetical protein
MLLVVEVVPVIEQQELETVVQVVVDQVVELVKQ